MLDRWRFRLLRFLRVAPQPTPPAGAPRSIRVFRAGRNYYTLLLIIWGAAQVGAVGGIIFSLSILDKVDALVTQHAQATAETQHSEVVPVVSLHTTESQSDHRKSKIRQTNPIDILVRKIADWPSWTLPLVHWAEYAALAFFIVQIPITLLTTRLEYEQHWYIVTDRSLRIRTGLLGLKETTMSFANIQQVEVKQGPLQRLLRIADVRVQSAGGGNASNHHKADDSMHLGIFRGVDNPQEIRDLILARLRSFRQAGLGDHDDVAQAPTPSSANPSGESLAAAKELLNETRDLHASLRA